MNKLYIHTFEKQYITEYYALKGLAECPHIPQSAYLRLQCSLERTEQEPFAAQHAQLCLPDELVRDTVSWDQTLMNR